MNKAVTILGLSVVIFFVAAGNAPAPLSGGKPSFPQAPDFYSNSCNGTTFCGCNAGDTATGGGADCFGEGAACPGSSLNRSIPSAPNDPSGPGWNTLCRDPSGINCEPAVTWVQCVHTP